ncbi:Z1 domain-containing protein [Geobacter sp. FeAm09]|uniref:Z1 domain-containing protein n=1 Tax=Geobacter sp. FeAm09 TaxID=2597769 RepID=UPI00197A8683|nr:Z1 domain-containing protein [Geobacter sp. FeAm09]
MGYVQSGKTANFTALAARASDVGYRLIIVLSGIHDSLREQTQKRLNKELVQIGENWTTLTDHDNDFLIPPNPDGFGTGGTVLVVAKKIVPVLNRISSWLSIVGERMKDIPLLLVDDEADQGSINTKGNRRDVTVSSVRLTDEKLDPDTAPTRTNALIRSILNKCPRATYVAYTATPFANLFINPEAFDREVGHDLFPRDFVVQLPRPEGYTGTEELFGPAAAEMDVLRSVADEDVLNLRPKRRRKGTPIVVRNQEQLPQSLCDALLAFCIAGAIRTFRGITDKPHTMLVHVSHEQKDQMRIGEAIRAQLRAWRMSEEVQSGSMLNPIRSVLKDFGRFALPDGITEENIIKKAIHILKIIEDVAILNSTTGENLRYEDRPSCHLIAVGGNRLSRGLTLEGLTIAYFIRTTTTVDALLQMCRWYGFRSGYGDLIRIWTTQGIADWFVELAVVEQSLRDSILRLEKAGKRPDQMQVAVRAHSHLLLTSNVKSRMADHSGRTWSAQCPQTILLPLSNLSILRRNIDATSRLLSEHPPTVNRHGGAIAFDIDATAITTYLRTFQGHPDAIAFNSEDLAEWIEERVAVGELEKWTIFVASPDRQNQTVIGDRSYGLVKRKPTGNSGIGILVDPRHEGVDLPGGPELYRKGNSYNANAMRANRSSSNGLLLIYPLDPIPLGVTAETVIALAASLPKTGDDGETYFVNSGVPRG